MDLFTLDSALHQAHIMPEQHPGQANQVYIGIWNSLHVAIRVPNKQHNAVHEFYDGIKYMFSFDYPNPYHYSLMHRALSQHSQLIVPRLLTLYPTGDANQIAPTHQFEHGEACQSFAALDQIGAYLFGRHIAALHTVRTTTYGQIGRMYPQHTFHNRLAETICRLLKQYAYDSQLVHAAKIAARRLCELPSPKYSCPIMLDQDPSQYFAKGGRLTHLIDLDFFAYGPRELELVALERLLPTGRHASFIAGYQSIQPFPHLSVYRPLYRVFNRLICVQGHESFERWHDAPIAFDL